MSEEIGKNYKSPAVREKYFSEMEVPDKVEVLRRELERTQKQVKDLCGFVAILLKHVHVDGKIFQPVRTSDMQDQAEESAGLWFRVHKFL
jgi:hypothetical protein